MNYVVFWIPSLFSTTYFRPSVNKIENINISDVPDCDLIFDLFFTDGLSFIVHLNKKVELKFNYKEMHSKGFLIYEVQSAQADSGNNFSDAIRKPIYHHFKGLFHKHEFHEEDQDSLLPAYLFESDLFNLDEIIKNSVNHYLVAYHEKFVGYHDNINTRFDEFRSKQFSKKYTLTHLSFSFKLSNQIIKSLGEFLYFDSLYELNHCPEEIYNECKSINENLKVKKELIETSATFLLTKVNLFLVFFGLFLSLLGVIASIICL